MILTMWKWIKSMFGPSDGKNFTRKEKKQILRILNKYEEHIIKCEKENKECHGLCGYLQDSNKYYTLCDLYHNRDFYREHTKVTTESRYYWRRKDYVSRMRAVQLLRDAVIND